VNGGGIPDLICHFSIPQANFQPGDTIGILKGLTNAHQAIVGDDTIVVH
jgi:transcription elongation factor